MRKRELSFVFPPRFSRHKVIKTYKGAKAGRQAGRLGMAYNKNNSHALAGLSSLAVPLPPLPVGQEVPPVCGAPC